MVSLDHADTPAVGASAAWSEAVSTTRDSVTVALWTAISRITGLVRVAVVAAVLGATYLGNTYQFTNSVPNLVYYGLLGGALVSSLLVPVLVRHLAAGDVAATARVASGFLGAATAGALLAVPVAVVAVPLVLRLSTAGAPAGISAAQATAGTLLVALLVPQVVAYAVIACSAAVMNARRRFALAAAAPALENVGSIAVLMVVWLRYGSGREITNVSTAELLMLGGGTTAAVVLHATVQWWGARRTGVRLTLAPGWRDPEVRTVLRRASIAILQAGLWTIQIVVMLALANRVPGGVVAVLIAMNFFFLPIALVATPVALSTLPRLAEHAQARRWAAYHDAVTRAVALTVFATVPAAVGYVVLAGQLGRVVSFGSMSESAPLIAAALAAVAAGVVGTATFTVATYACYAREDAWTPLRVMIGQACVAVSIMASSLLTSGRGALAVLTGGLATGALGGAAVLLHRLRVRGRRGSPLLASFLRTGSCAAAMAVPTWLVGHLASRVLSGRAGELAAVVLAAVTGAAVYGLGHRLTGSPELGMLTSSVLRRTRSVPVAADPGGLASLGAQGARS
ncbi:MAG: putative peptidoglycan lipid flippase [Pseudonocardiales bacterium]|nr:putative peptidoglycan lipid flippase [Pseudonocardiales bacterium]